MKKAMVSRLMKTARRDLEKGAKTPMHGKGGTVTPPEIRTALITKEIAEIQEGSVYSASIFDEFLFRFTAKKLLLSRSRKLPTQVATFIGTAPPEIASERYGCTVGAIL